jgi:flagellar biosynthetic protein FliR
MPGEFAIPVNTLYSFVLVLTRVAGIFSFLPLAGLKAGPDAARIVLSLAATLALFPRWPHLPAAPASLAELIGWMLMEATIGISIGLGVSFLLEVLMVAAQSVSLQAGFSYASTVDPTTSADSTVLLVIAQLIGGLLFFTTGLDAQVLKTLAYSLDSQPPGALAITRPHAEALVMAGAGIFSTGLRLALPLLTLLLVLDLSVGLLGRLNSQLQVLTVAMPVKMVVALAVLSWSVLLFPRLFAQSASVLFSALHQLFSH